MLEGVVSVVGAEVVAEIVLLLEESESGEAAGNGLESVLEQSRASRGWVTGLLYVARGLLLRNDKFAVPFCYQPLGHLHGHLVC